MKEMLSYLAAALPARTSAPARLLALQCALRSTASGRVQLPAGLLAGMRTTAEARAQLEDTGWMVSGTSGPGLDARLADPVLLARAPGRRARCRSAEWALQVCRAPALRTTTPSSQLLALTLAAQLPQGDLHTLTDRGALAYVSNLDAGQLQEHLDLLLASGFLRCWSFDRRSGDLSWSVDAGAIPARAGT
ncbi:hypothetical protein [Streptomyces sp. NPDC057718]|uniref:hypothetical protein n=1 Tax=Streptomyces sp. NPDC057718 TaxID=3346225 RepID=UPI003692C215